MRRILILFALALPASAADAPGMQDILRFYGSLGWVEAQTDRGPMVCIAKNREPHLDGLIAYLAHRATTCVGA